MVHKGRLSKLERAYGALELFSTVFIRDSYSGYFTVSLINHTGCILAIV